MDESTSQYTHDSSQRVNQPTETTRHLLTAEERQPEPFKVTQRSLTLAPPAVPDLDPDNQGALPPGEVRLHWNRAGTAGTASPSGGAAAFEFAGAPAYTRDKINPRALIDRMTKPGVGHAVQLGREFNGLPVGAELWQWYQHRGAWQNRLIHGDSSQAMQTLIAKDGLAGQVQMVFFDPPYGIGFNSNFQPVVNNMSGGLPTAAPMEVKAFRDTWERGLHSYLDSLYERLLLIRELLAPSGSVFTQISADNMTETDLILQEIFGADNRIARITYKSGGARTAKLLSESSTYLLWYAKDIEQVKYRQLYHDRPTSIDDQVRWASGFGGGCDLPDGESRLLSTDERRDPSLIPEGARIWKPSGIDSAGHSTSGRSEPWTWPSQASDPHDARVRLKSQHKKWKGHCFPCPQGRQWSVSAIPTHSNASINAQEEPSERYAGGMTCGMDSLAVQDRLFSNDGETLHLKRYANEQPGIKVDDTWGQVSIVGQKRYAVQTPNKIVERCVLASTDPGDLVLDPTCGSGVTAAICEEWGRRWITIDVSKVSLTVMQQHLMTQNFYWYDTRDGKSDPAAGFVCPTLPRASAATLAYCETHLPENQITLVDMPSKKRGVRRVTGPFTVETLLQEQLVNIADKDTASTAERNSLNDRERIVERLESAGVIDTADGAPALEVLGVRDWGLSQKGFVSHEARCRLLSSNKIVKSAPVVVCDTSTTFTKEMALKSIAEALQHLPPEQCTHLLAVALAFDPSLPKSMRGVELVRVEADTDFQVLELSNKAKGGFTILCDPDIKVSEAGIDDASGKPLIQVDILGVSSYDAALATARHAEASVLVQCWMIDTAYDGVSFLPSRFYFPNPTQTVARDLKKLEKMLNRAAIDNAAEKLQTLTSEPFPAGDKIAVKVILNTGHDLISEIDTTHL